MSKYHPQFTLIKKAIDSTHAPTARMRKLVDTSINYLEAWFETIKTNGSLNTDDIKHKESIIGKSDSLLDAIVDLSTLSLKFEEHEAKLEEGQSAAATTITPSDEDIIRRYLATREEPVE